MGRAIELPNSNAEAPASQSSPGHTTSESQGAYAGGTPVAVVQGRIDNQTRADDGYPTLRSASEIFEDVQRTRIAVENRIRTAPIDVELIRSHLEGLHHTEHQLALYMRRVMRKIAPEITAWQKETPGVGEHLLARLLGQIGHPVTTTVHAWEGTGTDRTLVAVGTKRRRVSDLWSYCGHGDPTRRARKGMTAEEAFGLGNPRAKMIVHLIAEGCMKAVGGSATTETQPTKASPTRRRSPYRDVYDTRRMDTAERVHAAPCVRCGPSGKPAPEGSPWSAGHQHADALRVVGKEFLRDLWIVAGGGDA